jgi:TrmH family RNA methyltransferase
MQLSSNEIRRIHSLSLKKFRDEVGAFVVEGEKGVCEALASDFTVLEAYHTRDAGSATASCIERTFPDSEISPAQMERITSLSSPSPAIAVLKIKSMPSAAQVKALISGKPLCLALDGVRDPGNLGTILRIADWFGIDAVFASPDTCELYNPKTVQASMGSIFRKRFIRCDLTAACRDFAAIGMPVFGTFLDGEDIHSARLCSASAKDASGLIVMGSESHGVSDAVASLVTRRLLIPPYPADSRPTDSLNVAVATAVICFAFRS